MLHKITLAELIDSHYISGEYLLKYCKYIHHLNKMTGLHTFESEPQSIDEIRGYCTEHFTWGSFSHEEAIKDLCDRINKLYTPITWECYPAISHASILQQVLLASAL